MSLKSKIIKELEKKSRRLRELEDRLCESRNDRRVASTVDEMYRAKEVVCRDGMYSLASQQMEHALQCKIVKLGRNFGFAKPDDGSLDVFIPGKFLMGAMTGDSVMVSIFERPRVEGSVEGEVLSILVENNAFVGTIDEREGRLVLVPDKCANTPLIIKKGADGGARVGEKAAGEIIERGTRHENHRLGISMRFGSSEEARQCAKGILYGAGIERHFPQEVKEEAKKYDVVSLDERAIRGREDLRALPIFTIDAASTKDIDDAISVAKTEAGYTLGVHIADVSEYVRPGSALNKEAFERATSVYYANSVVPMLPRQLSNGVCSLNEKEDRLAFSCIMNLDKEGVLVDYTFKKSLICSKVKGVYKEINTILAGDADGALKQKYAEVIEAIPAMNELYEKLSSLRAKRGSMDIESSEAKIIIDEDGMCVDVVKTERGISECMIEEFMLLANSCAANLGTKMKVPFVYRVHELPDPLRVENLVKALKGAGMEPNFKGSIPTQLELSALLDKTRGTALERFVHTNILRSMAKAKYEPNPKGHYGLALEDYAHFTSPIRRYPDLAIHRILSEIVAGESSDAITAKYVDFAAATSAQASEKEVAAMRVERGVDDCYKAEYMRRFIGESMDAVIASVTSFGIYVALENTVEGLVRAASLSTRPLTLVEGTCLKDVAAGKAWNLGDKIRVTVTNVDVSHGNVDFEPAV